MSQDGFGEPFPLEDFTGLTRLFPLPNVVMFPEVLVPLHIFEPRYRQMVADAMESDRLITMVLLKPGHEGDYGGSPPLHGVGCLGQVIRHEPLPDGRSNLVLRGLSRVRIDSEEPSDRLYRVARVTRLEDRYPEGEEGARMVADSGRRVLVTLSEILSTLGRPDHAHRIASAGDVPAGKLCDIASHSIDLDVSVKQSLLEELEVQCRADTLLAWMQAILTACRRRIGRSTGDIHFSSN